MTAAALLVIVVCALLLIVSVPRANASSQNGVINLLVVALALLWIGLAVLGKLPG